jgi:hypothetical protein
MTRRPTPPKTFGVCLVMAMESPWMSEDRKSALRLYRCLEKRFNNWSSRSVTAGEYLEELHCAAFCALDVVYIMHLTRNQLRSALRLIRSCLRTGGYFTTTGVMSPAPEDNAEVTHAVN